MFFAFLDVAYIIIVRGRIMLVFMIACFDITHCLEPIINLLFLTFRQCFLLWIGHYSTICKLFCHCLCRGSICL